METAIHLALNELAAALAALAAPHEGFRDLSRLNLLPETMREVRASLDQYDRRVRVLQAVEAPLRALVSDGYPELPPREVSDAALADIQANLSTLTAATQQFVSNAPTTLNLSAGAVEPK